MSSLSHLINESRDPDAEVARCWDPETRSDRSYHWRDFRCHVAALRTRVSTRPPGPFILLTEDAYAFAVGLLALLHDGRYAILPPNRQAGALEQLESRAVGILCDRPDWIAGGDSLHPIVEGEAHTPPKFSSLDPEAPCAEFYTSGTTGAEKPVLKRIRHLEDEADQLNATWGDEVRGARVFATASHQHLYGLLFGLLWPLLSERSFQSRHFLHPGELVPRMREAGPCILASVPTHLNRLARHGDAQALRGHCHVVFSSGGPLAQEPAHRISQLLGEPPIEVLGSTETGGIAWRSQRIGEEKTPWTPFSSVNVTSDSSGILCVDSPFVSEAGGAEGFATGDRVSLQPDGLFHLEGRGNRIAKIGEKRLDLEAMEARIRDHEWVSEVMLVTLERDSEQRVAAAIVPSEEGARQMEGRGRREFRDGIRASLHLEWDPVLHPRYWRVVARLPENAQGKVTKDALTRLFRAGLHGTSPQDRPEVLEELRGLDFLEQECRVPEDLSCFPGHFPDELVVPGVLQLDWALELAAELVDRPLRVVAIETLKLSSAMRPGQHIRIRVSIASEERITMRIWNDDVDFSRGRVLVESTGRCAS